MRGAMSKLPELSTPLREICVDATPDDALPCRILRAFLERYSTDWVTEGLPVSEAAVYQLMNEHNARRREILREAIKKLM